MYLHPAMKTISIGTTVLVHWSAEPGGRFLLVPSSTYRTRFFQIGRLPDFSLKKLCGHVLFYARGNVTQSLDPDFIYCSLFVLFHALGNVTSKSLFVVLCFDLFVVTCSCQLMMTACNSSFRNIHDFLISRYPFIERCRSMCSQKANWQVNFNWYSTLLWENKFSTHAFGKFPSLLSEDRVCFVVVDGRRASSVIAKWKLRVFFFGVHLRFISFFVSEYRHRHPSPVLGPDPPFSPLMRFLSFRCCSPDAFARCSLVMCIFHYFRSLC